MHPLDHLPDEAFPLVHGRGQGETLLITLPHRGNGLRLKCTACQREVWLGGRDLVLRFADWLDRPIGAWAAALRCQSCGSRRVTVSTESDPGGQGFFRSPSEKGPEIWDRRLSTWLAEVGREIEGYRACLPH
ncbi:MAG: hypothetical protein EBR82_09165 [Caulobacteraceae bacterium]|nr:hypothetical protein [Caulobacteraceae bacterium]